MPIVHSLVRQYVHVLYLGLGIERADLIQEGALALVSAYNRFDPSRGTFQSFAYACVRGAILDYIRENQLPSREIQKRKKQVNEFESDFVQRHKRMPEKDEYAHGLNLSKQQWEQTLKGFEALLAPLSFEHSVCDDGESLTIGDIVLVDPTNLEDVVEQREKFAQLYEAMEQLPALYQAALRGRYFDGKYAFEIGKEHGIKVEQVAYLNRQGLLRLKDLLASQISRQDVCVSSHCGEGAKEQSESAPARGPRNSSRGRLRPKIAALP